jgi:hypothetical protein
MNTGKICEHLIEIDQVCDECHYETVHKQYMALGEEKRLFERIRKEALKLACIEIAQLNISPDKSRITITDKVMPSYWLKQAAMGEKIR